MLPLSLHSALLLTYALFFSDLSLCYGSISLTLSLHFLSAFSSSLITCLSPILYKLFLFSLQSFLMFVSFFSPIFSTVMSLYPPQTNSTSLNSDYFSCCRATQMCCGHVRRTATQNTPAWSIACTPSTMCSSK